MALAPRRDVDLKLVVSDRRKELLNGGPLPTASFSLVFHSGLFADMSFRPTPNPHHNGIHNGIAGTCAGTKSGASVASMTWALETPGAVSTSVALPSGKAITASSVTTKSIGRVDVIGRSRP
jgi:hypothetical protein